jgi:hypothetical protein
VRIVQMKGVDLAQFQFDYDLTWAAFFMNADGTIYGRYGSRSIAGPMAHNSMESLKNAMKRALALHEDYPGNKALLDGKRGAEPRWKTALEIPALQKQFARAMLGGEPDENCIHCHNIYDGWHEAAYAEGVFDWESVWVYPMPECVGMQIDVDSGNRAAEVVKESFAAQADIKPSDVILTMNGQAIISQADMQWVLHNLPKTATLRVEIERDGEKLTKTLSLSGNWKKSDISWRGSLWSLRPKLKLWAPELSAEKKAELGLKPDALALEVRWIPNEGAQAAGLKNGDIIVEAGGRTNAMSNNQLNLWVKLNYQVGDELPIKVRRGAETLSLSIPLVE